MAEYKYNMSQWGRNTLFYKYMSQNFDAGFFMNDKISSIQEFNKAKQTILEIGKNDDFIKALRNSLKYYAENQFDFKEEIIGEMMRLKSAIQTVVEHDAFNDDLKREITKVMKKNAVLILGNNVNSLGNVDEKVNINRALQIIYRLGEGERLKRTFARILCGYSSFLKNGEYFYVDPNKLNDSLKYSILNKAKELELQTKSLNNGINLKQDEKICLGLNSITLKNNSIRYEEFELDSKGHKGRITLNNGRVYVGEFENGQLIKGKCFYPNLGVYEGHFLNLKKDGEGVFASENGDVYTGTWKNDFFDGIVTIKTKSGKTIVRKYDNGEILEEKEIKTNSNKRV